MITNSRGSGIVMIGFHASADQLAVKGSLIEHYDLIIHNNKTSYTIHIIDHKGEYIASCIVVIYRELELEYTRRNKVR